MNEIADKQHIEWCAPISPTKRLIKARNLLCDTQFWLHNLVKVDAMCHGCLERHMVCYVSISPSFRSLGRKGVARGTSNANIRICGSRRFLQGLVICDLVFHIIKNPKHLFPVIAFNHPAVTLIGL